MIETLLPRGRPLPPHPCPPPLVPTAPAVLPLTWSGQREAGGGGVTGLKIDSHRGGGREGPSQRSRVGGDKEPLKGQGSGDRRNLSKVKGGGKEGTSQRSKVKCICVHRWRPEQIFTAIEAPSSRPNLSTEDHPEFPQKQRTQPQWWCRRPAAQARDGQSIPHRGPSSAQIICSDNLLTR